MSRAEKVTSLLEETDSEQWMLIAIIALSLFMMFVSRDYTTRIYLWGLSILAIVFSVLLLVMEFLPEDFKRFLGGVEGSDQSVSEELLGEQAIADAERSGAQEAEAADEDQPRYTYQVMGLLGVYAVLLYLLGLTLSGPVFVFIYAVWAEVEWRMVFVLTALTAVITFVFIEYLDIHPFEGALVGVFI
ncbi:MAG: tripartite tricarboxylate transporter TctB family protein [Halobacteriales archaeon]|nr:tripartite tricarboxylate transporter TctB family protein [Halobacteriales archaeon]